MCLKKVCQNISHHNSNKWWSKLIKTGRHIHLTKLIKVTTTPNYFLALPRKTDYPHNRRWPARQLIRNTNNSSFYWTKELVSISPYFIPPSLWPPNSQNLDTVDYSAWEVLQGQVYRIKISSLDELMLRLQEEWTRLSEKTVNDAIN